MRQSKYLKRLNIEIGPELLKIAKKNALDRNITLRSWITRAIIDKIRLENSYK